MTPAVRTRRVRGAARPTTTAVTTSAAGRGRRGTTEEK